MSPGPAITRRLPTRNLIRPASTVKDSSCRGWAWLLGTRPPGARSSSHSSTLPSERGRIVIRSPLSGFSMTCPSAAAAPCGGQVTSRTTVVRAATAQNTTARPASSAAAAANGSGLPPARSWAGPNAEPPSGAPDRVDAAV